MCVLVNALGFPGLGTIMAKRPVGYAQAAITVIGFAVFMGYMLWFFAALLRVAGDFTADMDAFQTQAKSRLWIAGLGLALCGIAWVWALFSSFAILRQARQAQNASHLP